MAENMPIHEIASLRDHAPVFRDRVHAGEVLAGMLEAYRDGSALVLAVPAGGVPVAAEITHRLGLGLDVAVADAYEEWRDVNEDEVAAILAARD